MQTEPGENITGMEMEFKKLANVKADSTRFVAANLPCNKHKNRLVHILPYESSRVCLAPIRGVEGSDYINASFIDGYRYRSAYIAAQGPLQDTAEDFWRMLWEHNSTIVVMLTKLKEMGRVSFSIFPLSTFEFHEDPKTNDQFVYFRKSASSIGRMSEAFDINIML